MRTSAPLKLVDAYLEEHKRWLSAKSGFLVLHPQDTGVGWTDVTEFILPNWYSGSLRFSLPGKEVSATDKSFIDETVKFNLAMQKVSDTDDVAILDMVALFAKQVETMKKTRPGSRVVSIINANIRFNQWCRIVKMGVAATSGFLDSETRKAHDGQMILFTCSGPVTHELLAVRVIDILGHLFDDDEDRVLGHSYDKESHPKEGCPHGCTLFPGGAQFKALEAIFETWKPFHRRDWGVDAPFAAFASAFFSWWFRDDHVHQARATLEAIYCHGKHNGEERGVADGLEKTLWPQATTKTRDFIINGVVAPLRLLSVLERTPGDFATYRSAFDWAPSVVMSGVSSLLEPRQTTVGLWENRVLAYGADTKAPGSHHPVPICVNGLTGPGIGETDSGLHKDCHCIRNNLASLETRVSALHGIAYVCYPFICRVTGALSDTQWRDNVTRSDKLVIAPLGKTILPQNWVHIYHESLWNWTRAGRSHVAREACVCTSPCYAHRNAQTDSRTAGGFFHHIEYHGVIPTQTYTGPTPPGCGDITTFQIRSRTSPKTVLSSLFPPHLFRELVSLTLAFNNRSLKTEVTDSWFSLDYGCLGDLPNLRHLNYTHQIFAGRGFRDDVCCFDCSTQSKDTIVPFPALESLTLAFPLSFQDAKVDSPPRIQLRLPAARSLRALNVDVSGWRVAGDVCAFLYQLVHRRLVASTSSGASLDSLGIAFTGDGVSGRVNTLAIGMWDDTMFSESMRDRTSLASYCIVDNGVTAPYRRHGTSHYIPERGSKMRARRDDSVARPGTFEVFVSSDCGVNPLRKATEMALGFERESPIPVAAVCLAARFIVSNADCPYTTCISDLLPSILFAAMDFISRRYMNDPKTGHALYQFADIGSPRDIRCRYLNRQHSDKINYLRWEDFETSEASCKSTPGVKLALERVGRTILQSKAVLNRAPRIITAPFPFRKLDGAPRSNPDATFQNRTTVQDAVKTSRRRKRPASYDRKRKSKAKPKTTTAVALTDDEKEEEKGEDTSDLVI